RTERSTAGSKRGGQRSARAAGYEARAGIHQCESNEQGAGRRDQGAGTCFRVYPAGTGRAAATPPRAGTAFHTGSFAGARRAYRTAVGGNEGGQSSGGVGVFRWQFSVVRQKQRDFESEIV